MTQEERKKAMYNQGRADAQALQANAGDMTGTDLNRATQKIPEFAAACKNANMLSRPVGFICRSSAGRVVKLLQVYDCPPSGALPGVPTQKRRFLLFPSVQAPITRVTAARRTGKHTVLKLTITYGLRPHTPRAGRG